MLLPTDDLVALGERAWGSFLGRCVRRFLEITGIDRSLVLASQAFTALIPLLILSSTLAPTDEANVISRTIIRKFGLTGDSASAVEQLFHTPESGAGSLSVFSALLLVFSGVSFTRRLQGMYVAAWDRERPGIRGGLLAALGLLALLTEVLLLYGIRAAASTLPLDWLVTLPLSAATGLLLWTSIPYLLMNRQVHWRRLLAGGAISAVATAAYGVATTIYMPGLVQRYTDEFGLFGITIAIIGWLLVIALVLVASTAVGVELDRSRAPWALRTKARLGLLDPHGETSPALEEDEDRGLTSTDLVMLVRVLVNWLVITSAVWVATLVVPGIEVRGGLATFLWVSLLLGLVNALLGPVLWLVAMPLNVLTLGLSALAVNGVLLAVTAGLSAHLAVGGFVGTILGALLITTVTALLELVLRPIHRIGSPAAGRRVG